MGVVEEACRCGKRRKKREKSQTELLPNSRVPGAGSGFERGIKYVLECSLSETCVNAENASVSMGNND